MPVLSDQAFITRALQLQAPWHVHEVVFDSHRLTWVLGVESQALAAPTKRSWFASAPKGIVHTHTYRWQTLPVHGQNCEVVLRLQTHESVPVRPWTNTPQMPFTRMLEAMLEDYLLAGMTVQGICQVLNLPLQDVWQLKYRRQFGAAQEAAPKRSDAMRPSGLSTKDTSSHPVRTHNTDQPDFAQTEPPRLTEAQQLLSFLYQAEAMAWVHVVRGHITLQTKDFGLRLLLAQTQRSSLHLLHDPTQVRLSAQKIQRYFLHHQSRLGAEIEQIHQALMRTNSEDRSNRIVPSRQALAVPAAQSPVWTGLLTGQVDIETELLSLQLMLTKLKRQIDHSKSSSTVALRSLELKRYFEMNQFQLGDELAQLNNASRQSLSPSY